MNTSRLARRAAQRVRAAFASTSFRRRVYRTANAALGVAVIYRIVDGDQAAAWLFLINAVLGMADAKVSNPQSPDDQSGTE